MKVARALAAAALITAVAGTTTAAGASTTFSDPRWTFSQTNRQFEVYACDGSDADCSPGGQAGVRALTYCSDKDWLDDRGSLTWIASTRSLGGNTREFPAVQSFEIDRATETWANVPPSPGDYSTGDGGLVFSKIVCGDGTGPEPTTQDGDTLTLRIKVAGRRIFKPRPVRTVPGRQLSRVEVKGQLTATAEVSPDEPVFEQGGRIFLRPRDLTVTGTVRLEHHFRACLNARCTQFEGLRGKKTVRLQANTSPNAQNPFLKIGKKNAKGPNGSVRRVMATGRPWDGGVTTPARVASSQLPKSGCKRNAVTAIAAVRSFRGALRQRTEDAPLTPRGQTLLVTDFVARYCGLPAFSLKQRTISRRSSTKVQRIALPMNGRFTQSGPSLA